MMEINKIYHGDSFELINDIPDNSVDLILEDMPYGITACKWDVKIDLKAYWKTRLRILKKDGVIALTASQPFTSMLVMSNLKMFKYEWIWFKTKATGHLDANRKPMRNHENILVFGHSGFPIYYPQELKDGIFKTGRNVNMDGKVYSQYKNHKISNKSNYPKTIIKFSNPSGIGHLHPTQKPVELFEYLIKTYTNEGDLVFDGFAGSGTTAVACLNTSRNFICIEKEQEYFELAEKRIQREQSILKLKLVA